jgi:two-component system sensor histidine kinase QseC
MKSIRQYLLARLVWGSIAILAASSVVLGLLMRHLDMMEFDDALEVKARTLATLVLREGRAIDVDFAGEYMREFGSAEETEYFQFRLGDGTTIARSDMLGDLDLPFHPLSDGAPVFKNLRLPDGRRGRLVQIAFSPREGEVDETIESDRRFLIPEPTAPSHALVVLTLAHGRDSLDALLLKIYQILAGTTILLAGLLALSVRTALREGFRPLASLNEQIGNLQSHGLDRRIHLPDAPHEIAMLPVTLNSLLDELQDSVARERRFVSDVAHELRTPVAEFRAACEVGAKWSDDPALVRRRFDNLQQSAANMEQLLNGLLDLSRLDSGIMKTRNAGIGVAALLDSCWERILAAGPDMRTRMENLVDPDLIVDTDKVKLEMMVFNLLGNAACYSVPGSAVTCSGRTLENGCHELRISNLAHGLEPGDLPHIFERFWRKDAARTGGRHSGLGLSIVKALAEVLGIQVTVELSSDSIFTVRLRLPFLRQS